MIAAEIRRAHREHRYRLNWPRVFGFFLAPALLWGLIVLGWTVIPDRHPFS